MDDLFQPISNLNGVGGKRTAALERLGIATPYDLLYHIPRSYLDFSDTVAIAAHSRGTSAPFVSSSSKSCTPVLPPRHGHLSGAGHRRHPEDAPHPL